MLVVGTRSPRFAAQRIRLWAKTAQHSHAAFAEKFPTDSVRVPPFFDVVDGELDDDVFAVEGIEVDGAALQVGEEAELAPVGPQRQVATRCIEA